MNLQQGNIRKGVFFGSPICSLVYFCFNMPEQMSNEELALLHDFSSEQIISLMLEDTYLEDSEVITCDSKRIRLKNDDGKLNIAYFAQSFQLYHSLYENNVSVYIGRELPFAYDGKISLDQRIMPSRIVAVGTIVDLVNVSITNNLSTDIKGRVFEEHFKSEIEESIYKHNEINPFKITCVDLSPVKYSPLTEEVCVAAMAVSYYSN